MIENIIIRLCRKEPFYAGIIMQLHREARTDIPTLCVFLRKDFSFGLLYNEDFLKTLSLTEQEAVLIHECLHIINLHLLTTLIDKKDAKKRDILNIAMDLAINQYINGLPKDCVNYPEMNKFVNDCKAKGYLAKSEPFEPEETHAYYFNVLMKISKALPPVKGIDEHGNNGDKDKPGQNEIEVPQEMLKEIVKGVVDSAKQHGTVPNNLNRMVSQLSESQIDWRKELRKFVGDSIQVETVPSVKKYNRRYAFDFPGKKVVRNATVIFAVDTSGSMDQEIFRKAWAEIKKVNQYVNVYVAEIDADVNSFYLFNNKTVPQFLGGGGTCFEALWQFLERKSSLSGSTTTKARGFHLKDVKGIIYFTDGYCTWPKASRIPTIWLMTTEEKPTFGKHLRIK